MAEGSQAEVSVAITADDKTAKGVKEAEKRFERIGKRASDTNARAAKVAERTVGSSSRSIVRSFGQVEAAGAKIFGGRSVMSGVTARLGGITQATSAMGEGFAGAAAEGSGLMATVGGLSVAVAGTVGLLMAGAFAAFKLADGWAKGAASMGRTAEMIGVSTRELQEFTAAAERVGVDKGAAGAGLGSLSQTLNDARYGRNAAALEVLRRLGVKMALNSDGTVNVGAMLPAIADAIARQNSSGRRTAARGLGIPLDALPAFSQGGKALAGDMKDADAHAPMVSDADVARAKRLARKRAQVDQLAGRAMSQAGSATADALEPGYDAVLSGGTKVSDAINRNFASGSRKVEHGGSAIERGARLLGDAVEALAISPAAAATTRAGGASGSWRPGGRMGARQVAGLASRGTRLRDKLIRAGFSADDATALAANAMAESTGDYRKQQPKGPGYGLWQWGAYDPKRDRRRDFQRIMGKSIYQSSEDEQIAFLKWELSHTERAGWARAHARGSDAANVADGFNRWVERPQHKDRDGADRANIAQAMQGPVPVHLTVDLRGAAPGTRATVRGGSGSKPAVSHAMEPYSYSPVHGG